MIKNILAFIGALAVIAAVVALAVVKPWKNADVVETDGNAAPAVKFDALRPDGVVVERVHIDAGKKPRAVLYISFAEYFNAPVLLRAFDRSGNEVGRSRRVLSGDREDAGYADFEFDARVPMKAVTFLTLTKSTADAVPALLVPAEEALPAEPVPAAENPASAADAAVPAPRQEEEAPLPPPALDETPVVPAP